MTWSSSTGILPAHLERFANELRDLSTEVRASVAGLTGDAVGRAVRDVLLRFWRQSPQRPSYEPRERPSYERREGPEWDRDGWDHDEDRWQEPEERQPLVPPSISVPRLALLLQGAGCVLEYSPWLLVALGLGVGGFALLGGDISAVASFDAINKVADLASLITLLTAGAKHLGSI